MLIIARFFILVERYSSAAWERMPIRTTLTFCILLLLTMIRNCNKMQVVRVIQIAFVLRMIS
jgi:hypothetical protein